MRALLYYLAWEWINIAIEYTTVAWTRLPKLFIAVVGVNLVTHPIFMVLLAQFGRGPLLILGCEMVIPVVEWLLLMAAYRRSRWRLLLGMSFLMNAVSYGTGLLIEL